MKKLALLVLFSFFKTSVHSQPWPYIVSAATSSFTPLSNAVSLNNGMVWTDTSNFVIPIPNFSFELTGIPVDTIRVRGGHFVKFAGAPYIYYLNSFGLPNGPGYIFKDKGTVSSLSPISYEFSGPPGSQILKIEWGNLGFIPLLATGTTAYFNYQMWLFEGDHHIELHSGPIDTSGVNPQLVPTISFLCVPSILVWVYGDPAAPLELWTSIAFPNYDYLDKFPDEGTVIIFNPNPLYIGLPDDTNILKTKLFPNPLISTATLQVSSALSEAVFVLYDSHGTKVKELTHCNGHQIIIQREHLAAGLYYYNLITKSGIESTGKILIADL